jgi:hypothetical protein
MPARIFFADNKKGLIYIKVRSDLQSLVHQALGSVCVANSKGFNASGLRQVSRNLAESLEAGPYRCARLGSQQAGT